jgi:predicted enzyme related to lactoylglutathione lyase
MSAGSFRSVVPQFTVPDVVRTAEYYRDVWGFRIAGYWRDPPLFAIVERDGIELFFNQARPGTTPRTGRVEGGYDLYLHVRGLDALARELAERGATILEGPVLREYGQRELVVRDCNGLVLALGEESASAVAATHTGRDILEKLEQVPPLSAEDAAVMYGVIEENRAKAVDLRERTPGTLGRRRS